MTQVLLLLQHNAATLFAWVVVIVAMFLVARVARLSQAMSLALALTPMAYVVAFSNGVGAGLI